MEAAGCWASALAMRRLSWMARPHDECIIIGLDGLVRRLVPTHDSQLITGWACQPV
jgi:hypothetical protein